MGFTNWVKNIFASDMQSVSLQDLIAGDTSVKYNINIYCVGVVAEIIATLMSKCTIKTYQKGTEKQGEEWYSLNFQPNQNQNATEFWREFYYKMLTEQEALIFQHGNQKIIADTFNVEPHGVRYNLYSQISREDFDASKIYRACDVIYAKYSNCRVSDLINELYSLYSDMVSDAQKRYSDDTGRKLLLNVSTQAQGNAQFKEQFKEMQNTHFKNFFKNKDSVLPLFNGYSCDELKSTSTKSISETTDINAMILEALSKTALAYKIHPAFITGDVAGTKEAVDYTLMACINPLAKLISNELTVKLLSKQDIMNGSYIKVDTLSIRDVDLFNVATAVDKLIASGFMSIDEVREYAGLDKVNDDWGNTHWITKNYNSVDTALAQSQNTQNTDNAENTNYSKIPTKNEQI